MVPKYDPASTIRSFVKLKKIQKILEKLGKWVGGPSPNSDFYFFGKCGVFLCYCCCYHVSKCLKKGSNYLIFERASTISARFFFVIYLRHIFCVLFDHFWI